MPKVAINSAARAKKLVMKEPTRSSVTDCCTMSANVATPWMGCAGSRRSIVRRISETRVSGGRAERTNICIGFTGVTLCSRYTSATGGLFKPSLRMSPTIPIT